MKTNPINRCFFNNNPTIFLLCCDLRNFSSVARALDISPSAVSKAIVDLENELCVTLFDRSSRPMKPTQEALLLRSQLCNISSELKEFVSKIQNQNLIKPKLKLGVVGSFSTPFSIELTKQLSSEMSSINVAVGSANFLFQRLMERKTDVVVSNDISEPNNSKRLSRLTLLEEPSIIILPKKFETHQGGWNWEALSTCGLPLLRFGEETAAGISNELFLKDQNLQLPERFVIEENTLMLNFVAANVGWVFARPTTLLQNKHLLKDLCIVPMPEPNLYRKIYVFSRKDENEHLLLMVKAASSRILREKLLPEIEELVPWTKSLIKVYD